MNPLDLLELEILDATGDVELAQLAGERAIASIRTAAGVLAGVLGLDEVALTADILVQLGISAVE
jgi:hypothetical protein